MHAPPPHQSLPEWLVAAVDRGALIEGVRAHIAETEHVDRDALATDIVRAAFWLRGATKHVRQLGVYDALALIERADAASIERYINAVLVEAGPLDGPDDDSPDDDGGGAPHIRWVRRAALADPAVEREEFDVPRVASPPRSDGAGDGDDDGGFGLDSTVAASLASPPSPSVSAPTADAEPVAAAPSPPPDPIPPAPSPPPDPIPPAPLVQPTPQRATDDASSVLSSLTWDPCAL